MPINDILKKATQDLKNISSTPHLDAELLLAHALNKPRTFLHTHPEYDFKNNQFEDLLKRRLSGEPIAYILGHKEFWSLDLKVNKDVLIPRPETELLVELALAKIPAKNKIKLADLGTGSGAIAVAIASERPHWEITATDISPNALKIAKHNAKNLGINNINFLTGNWGQIFALNTFEVIISNPPYLNSQNVINFEPATALISAENGLQNLRIVVAQAKDILKPGGLLMLEHGFDQAEAVHQFMQDYGYTNITNHKDLAGLPRVTIGEI